MQVNWQKLPGSNFTGMWPAKVLENHRQDWLWEICGSDKAKKEERSWMIYIPFSVIALNCPLKGSIKYPQAQNNSFSHAFSYSFSASRVSSPLIVELSTSTICVWLGTLSFIGPCLFQISSGKHTSAHVLLAIKLYPTHGMKHNSIQSIRVHSPDETDQIQFFKSSLGCSPGVRWQSGVDLSLSLRRC